MRKGMFDMYEGLKVREDGTLEVEKGPEENVETQEFGSKKLGYQEALPAIFDVPEGTYDVRVKVKLKSDKGSAFWKADMQGKPCRPLDYAPRDWKEEDSGWVEDVEVKDGSINIVIDTIDPWDSFDNVYVDWVELEYRKVG